MDATLLDQPSRLPADSSFVRYTRFPNLPCHIESLFLMNASPLSHLRRLFAIFLLGLAASATPASAAGTTYSVAGTNPFPSLNFGTRLVSGDFNNDGKLDILYQTNNVSGANISVQLGNGDGTFQAAINQPTSTNFTSGPFTGISFTHIVAGNILLPVDLNGDGRVDVIDNQGSSTTARLLINGVAGFSVGTSPFPIQVFSGRFVFGDFNNDGLTDALNQNGGTSGTAITLYLNTPGSPGTFSTIAMPTGSAFTSGPLTGITFTQVTSNTVYAVDLNGDGRVDIVDAQGGGGATPVAPLVYQNTGSGFSPVTSPFAAQPFGSRFVFGDFSGDGYVDALNQTSDSNGTAASGSAILNAGITLYLNNGTGSFTFTTINKPDGAGQNFSSGPFSGIDFTSTVYNVQLVADFDRDTLPEVVDLQNTTSRYLDANVTAPLITSSTPANAATGVSTGTSIVLNFNKNVTAGAGNIRIKKTSDNSTVQTLAANGAAVSGSGTSTITITPPSALAGSTAFYLTFDINCFTDSNSIPLAASSGITRVPITSPSFLGFTTTAAPSPTTVTSLNRVNPATTNLSTVNWTLTFAAANTGVSASNFSLSGAAATGATVGTPTIASGGGLTWNVPVTTGSTDGTLTLNLDNATGTTPGVSTTLPFTTAGQSYTMDKTLPTVLSIVRQTPTSQATSSTSLTFRVTFSEPINAPTAANFAVAAVSSSITGSIGTVTAVNSSTYDVPVTITGGSGEFRLKVIDGILPN